MTKPRLTHLGPRLPTLGARLKSAPSPSDAERIRGRRLQRIREEHFRAYPLCVACAAKGIVRLATELDHVVALVNGGRDEPENRQGLCGDCHKAKTNADLGHKPRRVIGVDGYPIEE